MNLFPLLLKLIGGFFFFFIMCVGLKMIGGSMILEPTKKCFRGEQKDLVWDWEESNFSIICEQYMWTIHTNNACE